MTTPTRPHLRLVGGPRRDDGPDFEPVDRPVHDRHDAYRELEDSFDDEGGEIIDADFARPAGSGRDDDDEAADAPRGALQPRFAIAALIAFQLLAALGYVDKYLTLARSESVYVFAAALAAPASLCLYAGAALLALKPGSGRALFVVATIGFGLSVPAWGIQYGWTWPMAFGSMLGLAGAWCARPEIRPAEHEEAQP